LRKEKVDDAEREYACRWATNGGDNGEEGDWGESGKEYDGDCLSRIFFVEGVEETDILGISSYEYNSFS
jgi:hypothetical protein